MEGGTTNAFQRQPETTAADATPEEQARLRAAVLHLGGLLGWSEPAVVAFSEGVAGRPWTRCGAPELRVVIDEYRTILLAIAARMARQQARALAAAAGRSDHGAR